MHTDDLRRVLAERATDVDEPHGDVLAGVRRGVTAGRRRRAGAAVVTAVVLTAVVVGGNGLRGAEQDTHGPAQQPEPTPTTGSQGAPAIPASGALAPGTWSLLPVGDDTRVRALVQLPAGFESGGWFIGRQDTDVLVDQVIGFWEISSVFADGCTHDPGPVRTRTAQDAVAALYAQRRTTATSPSPVRLDGHDGLALEVRTDPGPADYTACVGGRLGLFRATGGDERWIGSPGPEEHYWVVDLEGGVYLVEVGFEARPGSDARAVEREVAELDRIAEAVRFDVVDGD